MIPQAISRAPDLFLPRPFQITGVRRETPDTVTLRLRSLQGDPFSFQPGQFNMLYLFGVGEVPISISGVHPKTRDLEHTVRAVGSVTRALVRLRKGHIVGLRGPFGRGWPLEEARGRDILILAGGIGLAPLRPVLQSLMAHRRDYEQIVLLYGARTPADLLYPTELERWRGRLDLQVFITVDRGDEAWRGHIGVVTTLLPMAERFLDLRQAIILMCGPEVMMRVAARELENRGASPEQIFLSLERNMKCAVGFCGHCQFGPAFICRDGPVFPLSQVRSLLEVREL
ncbi:MAG: FAD/NAD(P)-binding protein [Armatimonadota bacterium]|nr:FAD/NAD(P)-binding protein [Armatimonadota bacterium]